MAEEGPLVGGRYQKVRTLGKGAYGLVVLAKDVESSEQVVRMQLLLSTLLSCRGLCLLAAAWHMTKGKSGACR